MEQRKVIIITGEIDSGKTTFLLNISSFLRKNWRIDGFLSLPQKRPDGKKQSAYAYNLKFIKESSLYEWATKKNDNSGYHFNDKTKLYAEEKILSPQVLKNEIIILDDIGHLEASGDGFSKLFTNVLNSNDKTLIVSIKKSAVKNIINKFAIKHYKILDLDIIKGKERKNFLLKEIRKADSNDIGIFATINGITEISFGSALHAAHFPQKGFILVGLQNFFLILFAKELKGRGLLWITIISAGMKSFSPAGGRLRPMLNIFIQGLAFSIPSMIMGWNIFSAMLGSLSIQLISIATKFGFSYMLFGHSIFTASVNATNKFLGLFSEIQLTIWGLLLFLIVVKSLVAVIITLCAYYLNSNKLLFNWRNKISKLEANSLNEIKTFTWKESLIEGLKDITLKRFLLPFVLGMGIIFFFSNLTTISFISIATRAITISWVAFVLSRRINFNTINEILKKRGYTHISDAMNKSIKLAQSFLRR